MDKFVIQKDLPLYIIMKVKGLFFGVSYFESIPTMPFFQLKHVKLNIKDK